MRKYGIVNGYSVVGFVVWSFRAMSVGIASPAWFKPTLNVLVARVDLVGMHMCEMMQGILSGGCGEAETAALLVALRMKGETAEELAAAAAVLREHMHGIDVGGKAVLDTCGTGGDGASTFNISTATALVAAGAGVPVVKHGNSAMSSRSGSADVLTALGVDVQSPALVTRRCLDEVGMLYCHAPCFHSTLRRVGELRRRLGVRTLFNCLGPLANPARAEYQLLGVGRPEWLDSMAGALARLGTRHALLVAGRDGLDEVSLSAPTLVHIVRAGTVSSQEWTPANFGLEACRVEELRASSPADSAATIREVLAGQDGPALRIVVANAAAALIAAERTSEPRVGVELARASIASGHARRVLEGLIAISH